MTHVCFALYDKTGRYSKFTGTTMLSIFENTNSDVTVHILHDNTLTADNRDKFIQVAECYKQRVEFYNVEELCADKLSKISESIPTVKNSRVSIATFYRFLIPALFPPEIDKIIYLDSDIIVNLDINELWCIELGDKPLAVIPEVEADSYAYKGWAATRKYLIREKFVTFDDYFNAGVLLINLEYLRHAEDIILNGIRFYATHPQCNNFDQDILNYLFSKECVKLSAKFDHFVTNKRFLGETVSNEIYHYVLESLQMNINDPFNRLWLEYFAKTPWFDIEIIGRLYDGILQMFTSLRASMIKLTAVISDKKRVFVMRKNDADAIRQIFDIRADEEVIIADKYIPRQEVFESMNASRGKKFFFIFMLDFPFVNFEKMGFVRGKDFVNGFEFVPEFRNVLVSSHLLLKEM